jgi:cobalt-precorrin 5A hydrolase
MGGDEAMSIIVAGIGCRRDCSSDAIVAVVRRACAEAGREPSVLAAPEFKMGEAGLHAAANSLGLVLVTVARLALEAVQERCVTRSEHAARAIGVASVAEGCALAAAGMGGRLILPRISGEGVTCALAECATR